MHKTLTFENLLKSVEVRLDYGSPDVVSLPAPAAAAISTSFSAFTAHVWFVVRNVLRRRWTYSFDRSRNYRRVCHVSLLHYPVKLLHFGPPRCVRFLCTGCMQLVVDLSYMQLYFVIQWQQKKSNKQTSKKRKLNTNRPTVRSNHSVHVWLTQRCDTNRLGPWLTTQVLRPSFWYQKLGRRTWVVYHPPYDCAWILWKTSVYDAQLDYRHRPDIKHDTSFVYNIDRPCVGQFHNSLLYSVLSSSQ